MATIENGRIEDLQALLDAMNEPELIGQQLVQQGAIHCLTFLLQHGCHPVMAARMLDSLTSSMALVSEIAARKGFTLMFIDTAPAGLH